MNTGATDPTGTHALDAVDTLLSRFVAFPTSHARHATTLWAAHTHLLDATVFSPRLVLTSPEKGSGKTRCLEILKLVAPRPLHAVQMSEAALFRLMGGEQRPTVLFDEGDTIFGPHARHNPRAEGLRAIINSGWEEGAVVPRCGLKDYKVEYFPIFGAVAIAGIGAFPDTITDRSVLVEMRRRAPDETVEPFHAHQAHHIGDPVHQQLAEWADTIRDDLPDHQPASVEGLTDRPWDIWRPLIAIAEQAGGHWPRRATDAAVHLNERRQQGETSDTIRLLADIRTAFAGYDRMQTSELVVRLGDIDEAQWREWHGREFTATTLAKLLKGHGIAPRQHKFDGKNLRGYLVADFTDAWNRYLPPPPATPATPATNPGPQNPDDNRVAPVAPVAAPGSQPAVELRCTDCNWFAPRLVTHHSDPTRRLCPDCCAKQAASRP